jgi:hypothetical protein
LVDEASSLAQVLEVAVVFNGKIGSLSRLFGQNLCGNAGSYARFVDAVACHHARNTLVFGRYDDDRLVDEPVVSGFEEQGDDMHDELTGPSPGFALHRETADVGMENRVQTRPRRGIAKHDIRKRGAVEHAAAYGLGENAGDLHEAVTVRGNGFACERVGIDDKGSEFFEDFCGLALSRADATRQTDARTRNLLGRRFGCERFDRKRVDVDLLDGVLLDLFRRNVGDVLDRCGDPARRVVDGK